MTAYPYGATYLLRQFKRFAGRPPAADAVTDASYYERLTDAQLQIVADIAAIVPEVLYPTVSYSSIPTMTTTDNQTFTFGTSTNGFPLAPIGDVSIYRSLNDIPDCPMVRGQDFIPLGGTSIQVPNNQTYLGTLYWRGIAPPGVIDGTHDPVLFPEGARELIVIRAVANFAQEGNRDSALYQLFVTQYGYPLAGNPGRFAYWCQVWREQYRGGGALQSVSGLQIAAGSYVNSGGA